MSNFVIFASARTGSTSLANVLGESKDVKICFEPFNPDYTKWNPKEKNYSDVAKDTGNTGEALDELFEKFTAIKTLDYQLSEKSNFLVLGRKDLKILFLTRKNIVEQIISDLVAHQTKNWRKPNDESIYDKLEPIDISEMQKKIDYVTYLNNKYLKFLEENRKGEYMRLFYEELFSEDMERNTTTISNICEFLGVSVPPNETIEKYMMPSRAKINYKNIYKKLPNYEEVKQRFGKLF